MRDIITYRLNAIKKILRLPTPRSRRNRNDDYVRAKKPGQVFACEYRVGLYEVGNNTTLPDLRKFLSLCGGTFNYKAALRQMLAERLT